MAVQFLTLVVSLGKAMLLVPVSMMMGKPPINAGLVFPSTEISVEFRTQRDKLRNPYGFEDRVGM